MRHVSIELDPTDTIKIEHCRQRQRHVNRKTRVCGMHAVYLIKASTIEGMGVRCRWIYMAATSCAAMSILLDYNRNINRACTM